MKLSILSLLFSLAGCQAPVEPAALQGSGVAPQQSSPPGGGSDQRPQTPNSSPTNSLTFAGGGAAVGTDSQKSAAKTCIEKKLFYDRFKNREGCTTLPLANSPCIPPSQGVAGISAGLSPANYQLYQSLVTGQLAGYILDQCLDCSTPSTTPACEGQTKQKDPGVRVFFAKDLGNGSVESVSVYFKN